MSQKEAKGPVYRLRETELGEEYGADQLRPKAQDLKRAQAIVKSADPHQAALDAAWRIYRSRQSDDEKQMEAIRMSNALFKLRFHSVGLYFENIVESHDPSYSLRSMTPIRGASMNRTALRRILAEEGLTAAMPSAAVALRKKIRGLLSSKSTKIEETSYRNNPGLSFHLGMDDDAKAKTVEFLALLQRAFPDMALTRPRKTSYGSYMGKLSQGDLKFLVSGSPAYPAFDEWDDDTPVRVRVEVFAPKERKPAPKAIPANAPLTKQQWSAILRAMSRGYGNSHAMMVDDSFGPFERAAKKYGLGAYYDGEVFSFLHRKVTRFDGKLSATEVAELNDLKKRDS